MFRTEIKAHLRRNPPPGGRLAALAASLATSLAIGLVLAGAALSPAMAEDVKMYKEAPSAKEMSDVLFGDKAKEQGVKFRGITFTGDGSKQDAPAAAPEPTAIGFNIQFKYNSVEVEDGSRVYLDRVGEMMKMPEAAGQALIVEGHTDAAGSDAYNMDLSKRRAEAVRQYLITTQGIEPGRLIAEGKGEAQLLDKQDPYSATNRRVQFRRAQ